MDYNCREAKLCTKVGDKILPIYDLLQANARIVTSLHQPEHKASKILPSNSVCICSMCLATVMLRQHGSNTSNAGTGL